MAAARTNGSILEFSVRDKRLRLILLFAAALLLIALAVWPKADAVVGYSYPIPSDDLGNDVEVLNGTERRGLARAGTAALRQAGFDVVFFGNAPSLRDSTLVLLRPGSEKLAARLQKVLGTVEFEAQPDSLRRVAATIILGLDYRPPPAGSP